MNSTEEWLRYVESKVLEQKYKVKGYSTGSVEEKKKS